MSLTAAEVAEILRLVEASSFDEFSLELDGLKLNFKRSADGLGSPERPGGAAPPAVCVTGCVTGCGAIEPRAGRGGSEHTQRALAHARHLLSRAEAR